jgi:hypothetical protein
MEDGTWNNSWADCPCRVLLDHSPLASDQLPDHVCYETARSLTERYATSFPVTSEDVAGWKTLWPLPLGWRAIVEDLRHWYQDPSKAQSLLSFSREFAPDDRAGLVVEWHLPAVVRLIGLLTPHDDDPELGHTFTFAPARLETQAPSPGELEAAALAAKRLLGWYNRRILGQKTRGGRPPGTGVFPDRLAFLVALWQATEAARSWQYPLTVAGLARALAALGYCADDHGRQLRRWLQGFGFPDLATAIAAAEAQARARPS